jgi:hypothetical protein
MSRCNGWGIELYGVMAENDEACGRGGVEEDWIVWKN